MHVLEELNLDIPLIVVSNAASAENVVLVIDMVMPNMNGRELAEILSSQQPQLKVIYMSGFTEDFVLRQCLTEGTAFLRKPASAADLLQKVWEMLYSHSA